MKKLLLAILTLGLSISANSLAMQQNNEVSGSPLFQESDLNSSYTRPGQPKPPRANLIHESNSISSYTRPGQPKPPQPFEGK